MKRSLTFLKVAIILIGVLTLGLCLFWLPRLANSTGELNPELVHLKFPVLLGVYLTTIPFFLALFQGIKLLELIKLEEGFTNLSVSALEKIERCAVTISLIYIIGIIYLISENAFHPGIALIVLGIIFITIVIAVFAALLKKLLRDVLVIKVENDLMI